MFDSQVPVEQSWAGVELRSRQSASQTACQPSPQADTGCGMYGMYVFLYRGRSTSLSMIAGLGRAGHKGAVLRGRLIITYIEVSAALHNG